MTRSAARQLSALALVMGFAVAVSNPAWADGTAIDKVYNPYVQMLENEIEYRFLLQDDDGSWSASRHKLGFGRALSDRFFVELYAMGSDGPGQDMQFDAVEAELKWQLTEQGEYDYDWGLLFELERSARHDVWEASTTLIVLREWPRWIATGNLSLAHEWGGGIANEWETAFAGQLRYRHRQHFEPALEMYLGQDTRGVGPVLTGMHRFGGGKTLGWEFGVIMAVDTPTPDTNWKLTLEYEF